MSDHNPLTLKLNLREKIAYGMGDVGSNLMLSIGTLYLLKFYTDELGMPAYYGGIIFLVAKFFTAFTDMLTRCTDFRHLFQFAAQHFIDVGHLIKVVAAIVIHPLHHLIGAEGFFT